MVEPEVPLKKKDQVALDEEMARNLEAQLQAKLIEEEMLARKKEEEANIALIKSWDNIQAMIRKKHFAKLRAEEIRRKSPTKAQKRKVVKGMRQETKESSKRAGDELESEMLKKQKIDEHVEVEKDDQEEAEMKRYIEIVKDDEVAIDVIPLATKPPVIGMLEHILGKFDGKSDEGFFVGYSLSGKAFRVYTTRTKRVEENLHIRFLENRLMMRDCIVSNISIGTSEVNSQECIVMPIWKDPLYFDSPTENVENGEPNTADDTQKQDEDGLNNENAKQERFLVDSSSKDVNATGQQVNTASLDLNTGSLELNAVGPSVSTASPNEEDNTEEEPKVDLENITNSYIVPTTPNIRIHKDHPIDNVIGDVQSTVQTRRMLKPTSEQGFLGDVNAGRTSAIQTSTSLDIGGSPYGKKAIGTKWVFRNKKVKGNSVLGLKASFQAMLSIMGFLVYQMDLKSAFLYETIEEEVYVTQPLGFKDPNHPDKVYKVGARIDHTLFIKKQEGDILLVQVYVDDIIFGSTNKELCTGFEKLIKDKFQMSSMGELTFFLGLQVQQKEDGIFISQDKYVARILKKFNYSDVNRVNPVVWKNLLVRMENSDDVMISDALCACARFQVTPNTSHFLAVKRIFRYLKGKPTLGLWYSRDSLFELVAYTDSDYAGATLDRKSTTGGYLLTKGFDAVNYHCQANVNAVKRIWAPKLQLFLNSYQLRHCLKKRIQRLERRKISRPTGLKRLRKGRSIEDIDDDVDVSLVDETQERHDDDLIFDTGVLDDVEMPVEAKSIPTTNEEITLAQTLIQIKEAKPKVVTTAATTTTTRPKDKWVVVQEPSEFRVPQEIKPSSSKDKGKCIMIEPEKKVPLNEKDQIALDEQIARDIQAKLDAELLEEQKLAWKQEEEANITLIESWENTQAIMEADRLLAERLQSKEREELIDEENVKLFLELMEKRRKHFVALRAQEKRNKPPTKAQKRTQMSTYLKHMEKKEEGREEIAKGSRKKMIGRKRAVKEQQEEFSKKQKVEEEKESGEVKEDDKVKLKKLLVIKRDEDIAIDVIPLATKLPVIIEYKLHKEGMLVTYEFDKSNGRSKRYSSMIRMLQGIDREYLEALWR
ncbi:putative ribonuclease H-like domain-containing protein [Tanacetum coccineum]